MAVFDKYGSNLIFLISLPRSGSTLLQQILGGSPDILTLPEPWIMLHPLYALKKEGYSAEYEEWQARSALRNFLKNTESGLETYIDAVRSMASVLYSSALGCSDKNLFLDKTPRYYHIIPELYRVFPKAKFVFLLRNPLAVLSSVLKTWFDNNPGSIDDGNRQDMYQGPGLLVDGIRLLGKDAIVLHYESLVLAPELCVKDLCDRLGIRFLAEMLEYECTPHGKGQFGDAVGVYRRTRPGTDSLNLWVDNLASGGLVEFAHGYLDSLGEDLITRLGYNSLELALELTTRDSTES